MGRQYSAVSKAALKRLASLENHFGDLQARVDDVEKKVSAGTLDDLLESKNELAQINGLLEKLQFNQLDAVTTAELKSGKENAKVMRKQLNQAVEDLQRYTTALHKRISEQVEELKAQQQQEQPQQPQPPKSQAEVTQKADEVGEQSHHDNKPNPESNKDAKEQKLLQTETQQAAASNEQLQQEQESIQPSEVEAQEAEQSLAQSQVAMEMSPPPQPPAPATTAAPAGTSIPVRRRQAEAQGQTGQQLPPSQPQQQQAQAQPQVDPRRVPVHVGRSSQSRPAQLPVQHGLTRQQAAAMLQVIGLGYQHGMIDAHTRAVLKDRVLRQDPRLVNVWPTGDVYRDLTAMVRALQ